MVTECSQLEKSGNETKNIHRTINEQTPNGKLGKRMGGESLSFLCVQFSISIHKVQYYSILACCMHHTAHVGNAFDSEQGYLSLWFCFTLRSPQRFLISLSKKLRNKEISKTQKFPLPIPDDSILLIERRLITHAEHVDATSHNNVHAHFGCFVCVCAR